MNITKVSEVLNIAYMYKPRLFYKYHFLDGFRLRLRDLIEPNTFLPRSLSDRERWRGIREGGDGENEGDERGEME